MPLSLPSQAEDESVAFDQTQHADGSVVGTVLDLSPADAQTTHDPVSSTPYVPSNKENRVVPPASVLKKKFTVPQTPMANTRRSHIPLADITRTNFNMDQAMFGITETMKKVSIGSLVEEPETPSKPRMVTPRHQIEAREPPKPRLVIAKLVLHNFKSYAGRQEIGPFHSSFSAIVGPNGSGKSNVIDSLLFVFGFRASKMRHGKISNLIHKSESHPDLDSCTVEVHFQDVLDDAHGTKATVIEGSDLVVARRAYRNNSSRYTIDGRESSFSEVTTLLKDRGIDLDHKRFLILQGEVESIAQMKSKADNDNDDGLLEYLEDIIGTSGYKSVIEDARQKYEELNEDCIDKTNRLKIIEKELDGLQGMRDQVVKFLEVENAITLKSSALHQLNLWLCNTRIEASTKIVEETQQKLDEELAQTDGNQDQIRQLGEQYKLQSKELDALKKAAAEIAKQLSKLEIGKVQTEEKKRHLDAKRAKLEKTMQQAQHAMNESQSWLETHLEDSERLTKQVQDLETSLQRENDELNRIQDGLKDKTQVFSAQIEEVQKQLEPWKQKIGAKESEVAVAQSQVQELQERVERNVQAVAESKAKIHDIKKEGRTKEQALQALEAESKHVAEQMSAGKSECDLAAGKLDKMRQVVATLRQTLADSKQSVADTQSHGKVLAALTKLADTGRINGFHGRLGGLGVIDKKYDVAVSTACGALGNMVVEQVETGQKCVEYLRNNNLGRAKFILLDRLAKMKMDRIQTPENVPRLFDLIKPKTPMFAPAFYSVLGDTLVAVDATQARRIAYGQKQRWRVVTLDGMLIDTSGTMSGGGNKVLSGGMNVVSGSGNTNGSNVTMSESQVKEIEAQLVAKEQKLSQAEATFVQMEATLKEFEARAPIIELELSKTQLEIQTLTRALEESYKQHEELVKDAQTGTAAGDKELQSAKSAVVQREAELAELRTHSQHLEATIAELDEKIMEAGGVRLRMQKSKVDGIREQIQLVNSRIKSGVVDKTKALNEVNKQARVVANAERDIVAGQEEYEVISQAMQAMVGELSALEEKAANANDNVDQKQEALAELKAELDRKQQEVNQVRSREIELRNAIEKHQKSLREDTSLRQSLMDALSKLSLHDIAELGGATLKVEKQESATARDEDDSSEQDEDEQPNLSTAADILVEYTPDELQGLNKDQLKKQIARLEESNQNAKIDMQVLRDYKRRMTEYHSRREVLNAAVIERDAIKKQGDDLKQRRLDEFMTGFNIISGKLKEMYQMITMGGNAELELVDSLDPFSEGIIFSVMPPKKSWRNISNLSGGEKTLSSLALVFALHHYKPTPLYVMDEIDAALDFRNVSIVATYIKERTKHGQFIVISLRNNMFELARQLVGIYKVNSMTRSIALENRPMIGLH